MTCPTSLRPQASAQAARRTGSAHVRLVWAACATAVLLFGAAPVTTHAQLQPQAPLGSDADAEAEAEYQSLINDAVMEFSAGHYAEARALFLQAHQMRPNARTLRGLGMAAFEMRNYTEALRMLRASQTSQVNPLTDEQQAHVAGLVERADAFVGTFTVQGPEGTVYEVDGIRKELDEGSILMLDTGKRKLTAVYPDGNREQRVVDVRGRERGVLEFHGRGDGGTPAGAAPTTPASQTAKAEKGPDLLPWVLIGSGGALIVTGLFTGYAAYHNASVVDSRCPEGSPCDSSLQEVKDSAQTLAITTDILWVVGAAAAGVGTYLLLTSDDGESAPVKASVGASADGGGVLLSGRF